MATILFSACGGGSDAGESSPGADGARLYEVNACYTCHGRAGEGTPMGPAIQGASQHWTREQLTEYLLDPQSFVERDERLRQQMSRYPARMASFKHLDEEERGRVAEFVLGL